VRYHTIEKEEKMGYYENLQKAVDFMEANLKSDITLYEVASRAGYSLPHFYRVFTATPGTLRPDTFGKGV
jgi:transcriptional regulator GlxA family with amidase domain